MAVSIDQLGDIPLFRRITNEHIQQFLDAFERRRLEPGEELFHVGDPPSHLYLLVEGEIALRDEAGQTEFFLRPPAPIGELGVLTGIARNTTAVATKPTEVLSIAREDLMNFFEEHGDVAFPLYHNLLNIVADKVRRDLRRLEEMRANIIRTQKAMKRLRDRVLEAEETALSREIHDTLERLISQNRRWNYVVEPPAALPATVRLDSGKEVPVRELSFVWLGLPASAVDAAEGEHWSGVIVLPGTEFPVSGTVRDRSGDTVRIELDLLIDEYAAALEDYLTRVQMLDVIV